MGYSIYVHLFRELTNVFWTKVSEINKELLKTLNVVSSALSIVKAWTVSEHKRVTVSYFRYPFPTWCTRWPDSEAQRRENRSDFIPFFHDWPAQKSTNRFNQKTWNERTLSFLSPSYICPFSSPLSFSPSRLFVTFYRLIFLQTNRHDLRNYCNYQIGITSY